MKIYIVFKEGVYRHECGGAFSTLKAAREAALHFLASECDEYHQYSIIETELDARPPTKSNDLTRTGGGPVEADPVVTFGRFNGTITEES